ALMWLIRSNIPGINYHFTGQKWLGVGIFIIGVIIGLIGVAQFWKARTTVHPHKPEHASKLVRSGMYQFSRNPLYLGLLLGLTGCAVYLGNPLNVFCLMGFVLYMNRFQIIPEERAMAKNFRDDFLEYKESVRRWI
ncbi:MAG: methyltransferase, partial [Balneolaceae bacterium]|nr:methyltransferase [Balneolaceae bacterium]